MTETLYPTTRLKFVVVDNEMCGLFTDFDAFSKTFGLQIPADWPMFPEAFALQDNDPALNAPWTGYLFLDFKGQKIIGNGGFVKAPDENQCVEIGFEIAPIYQNQGYATEAVGELISFALTNGAKRIVAHTLPEKNASNRVLLKAGFEFDGTSENEEVGTVWCYAIEA